MLCCYEAKKRAGVTGKVIGLCHSEKSTERLKKLGFCDIVFSADATDTVAVLQKIEELTNGEMCDITINNVNIEKYGDDIYSLYQKYRFGLLLLHGYKLYKSSSWSRGRRQ